MSELKLDLDILNKLLVHFVKISTCLKINFQLCALSPNAFTTIVCYLLDSSIMHWHVTHRVLVKGQPHLAVEYKDRTFLLATEEYLRTFMRQPQKYISEEMHSIKLNNPDIQAKQVQLFPILGFLQQFAADIVSQCIISVGSLRPKYPFMNPATSVALYIGFYLKVNNCKAPVEQQQIFAERWKDFKHKCALLTSPEHQTCMLELYPVKNISI
ncbi:adenylate kinase 9-like [Schistocerca nitens]|uniref:adenylate kinase 9-like n=1 Tax=Schistocerca nitens TaxID=7011 RepID=UPI0021185BCA|nr:adenylate kinase 9-like [Schistocerca nitens]